MEIAKDLPVIASQGATASAFAPRTFAYSLTENAAQLADICPGCSFALELELVDACGNGQAFTANGQVVQDGQLRVEDLRLGGDCAAFPREAGGSYAQWQTFGIEFTPAASGTYHFTLRLCEEAVDEERLNAVLDELVLANEDTYREIWEESGYVNEAGCAPLECPRGSTDLACIELLVNVDGDGGFGDATASGFYVSGPQTRYVADLLPGGCLNADYDVLRAALQNVYALPDQGGLTEDPADLDEAGIQLALAELDLDENLAGTPARRNPVTAALRQAHPDYCAYFVEAEWKIPQGDVLVVPASERLFGQLSYFTSMSDLKAAGTALGLPSLPAQLVTEADLQAILALDPLLTTADSEAGRGAFGVAEAIRRMRAKLLLDLGGNPNRPELPSCRRQAVESNLVGFLTADPCQLYLPDPDISFDGANTISVLARVVGLYGRVRQDLIEEARQAHCGAAWSRAATCRPAEQPVDAADVSRWNQVHAPELEQRDCNFVADFMVDYYLRALEQIGTCAPVPSDPGYSAAVANFHRYLVESCQSGRNPVGLLLAGDLGNEALTILSDYLVSIGCTSLRDLPINQEGGLVWYEDYVYKDIERAEDCSFTREGGGPEAPEAVLLPSSSGVAFGALGDRANVVFEAVQEFVDDFERYEAFGNALHNDNSRNEYQFGLAPELNRKYVTANALANMAFAPINAPLSGCEIYNSSRRPNRPTGEPSYRGGFATIYSNSDYSGGCERFLYTLELHSDDPDAPLNPRMWTIGSGDDLCFVKRYFAFTNWELSESLYPTPSGRPQDLRLRFGELTVRLEDGSEVAYWVEAVLDNSTGVQVASQYNNCVDEANPCFLPSGALPDCNFWTDDRLLDDPDICGRTLAVNPYDATLYEDMSQADAIAECEARVAAENEAAFSRWLRDTLSQTLYLGEGGVEKPRDCLSGVVQTLDHDVAYRAADPAYLEHHFTLYYYDQAGDLVATVPPLGFRAGGEHEQVTYYQYNSQGQVLKTTTPDRGVLAENVYDFAARLRFWRIPQQRGEDDYSYNKFDRIGRVVESGEIQKYTDDIPISDIEFSFVSDVNDPEAVKYVNNSAGFPTEKDITEDWFVTRYDTPDPAVGTVLVNGAPFKQRNLRGRVSSRTSVNYYGPTITTYYSYDAHGNVSSLAHRTSTLYGHDVRIDYDYDLISGNVKALDYNGGQLDEFFHRYRYDDDNRLTHAYFSDDGLVFDLQARYRYYAHGPLARAELGADGVQGLDYAYTLQGWIKSVNSAERGEGALALDPGGDGAATANPFAKFGSGAFAEFGDDAYAYTLGYHEKDYVPIGGGAFASERPAATTAPNLAANGGPIGVGGPLYNGNVGWMRTRLAGADADRGGHLMRYGYDQLHRIRAGTGSFAGEDASGIDAGFSYDANGNLVRLRRSAGGSVGVLDDVTYSYTNPRGGDILTSIVDVAPEVNGFTDLPSGETTFSGSNQYITDYPDGKRQYRGNRSYDDKLRWVYYSGGYLNFSYDVDGNRHWRTQVRGSSISTDTLLTTIHMRGAGGELLATYERDEEVVLRQTEVNVYGSSRIGIRRYPSGVDGQERIIARSGVPETPSESAGRVGTRERGDIAYELSNHLGNVLSTVSNYKLALTTGSNPNTGFGAHLLTETDYYPFGSQIPDGARGTGREVLNYRFGFNGKENDPRSDYSLVQDYGFRIYWPALGRFMDTDPLSGSFAWLSPYNFASNTPIRGIDLWGLQLLDANEARISLGSGRTLLKLQNQSRTTRNAVFYAKPTSGTYDDGSTWMGTDFSLELGVGKFSLTVPPVADDIKVERILERKVPGYQTPKNRAQRRRNQHIARRTGKLPGSAAPAGPRQRGRPNAGRPSGGILDVVNFGYGVYQDAEIANDRSVGANQFLDQGQTAIFAVQKSIDEGLVIPERLRGPDELSQIANFVLQGEVIGNFSDEDKEAIITVARQVMYENQIEDRTN